ncbi:hypothetical protein EYF80_026961 [Liparis tanakae]|uniref:Uncharacterized protein n=1 Tax=Liparis tanakae TaxID=230148 RepID=A0A4Z2HAU5_9TELE|nr:hypothetical protein EYF80_026961 [Liparis tanakae]
MRSDYEGCLCMTKVLVRGYTFEKNEFHMKIFSRTFANSLPTHILEPPPNGMYWNLEESDRGLVMKRSGWKSSLLGKMSATSWRSLVTYIEFKGFEGHSEASGDRRVDPQSLLNDTARVFQLLQCLDVQIVEFHPLLLLKDMVHEVYIAAHGLHQRLRVCSVLQQRKLHLLMKPTSRPTTSGFRPRNMIREVAVLAVVSWPPNNSSVADSFMACKQTCRHRELVQVPS